MHRHQFLSFYSISQDIKTRKALGLAGFLLSHCAFRLLQVFFCERTAYNVARYIVVGDKDLALLGIGGQARFPPSFQPYRGVIQ